MRLQYNSPVILTFAIISAIVTFLGSEEFMNMDAFKGLFSVCSEMNWSNPLTYPRFVSHIFGHQGMAHFVGNFTLILLIGPILEEKYGSRDLLLMMVVTAVITSILWIVLFDGQCLLGASGIVFMLIVLSSLTNFQSGKIPLTFILVILLFLGKELLDSFGQDQVSQFGHIIGGICGGLFGFLMEGNKKKSA